MSSSWLGLLLLLINGAWSAEEPGHEQSFARRDAIEVRRIHRPILIEPEGRKAARDGACDRLGPSEIYLRLEAAGAVVRNGETTPDRSTFYCVLPSAQLRWALWIESQRMARMLAGLDEARLRRERALVLHEGSERGLYGWRGLMHQQRYVGVFPEGHPYTRFVEREGDVRALRLPHVQWFFQRHYGPDDATLLVVGGFEPDRVRASIERHFGPIVRSAPALEREDPARVAPLTTEITVCRAGSRSVAISSSKPSSCWGSTATSTRSARRTASRLSRPVPNPRSARSSNASTRRRVRIISDGS